MKEVLRSLLPDFGKKAIYDVLKYGFIFFVAPSLLVGGYVLLAYLGWNFGTGVAVGFISGLLFWLFVLLFSGSLKKDTQNENPLISIDPDYRIVKESTFYQYASRTEIHYSRHLKLMMLRDNVDRYVGKYSWTGKGKLTISVADSTQELIETRRKELYQLYEVKFARSLAKGEIVDVEIKMVLDDSDLSSVPVLSHTVSDPTELLIMKVSFPNGAKVSKRVVKSEYSHYSARNALSTITDEVVANECSWTHTNPTMFHRFVMQWVWKD